MQDTGVIDAVWRHPLNDARREADTGDTILPLRARKGLFWQTFVSMMMTTTMVVMIITIKTTVTINNNNREGRFTTMVIILTTTTTTTRQ